MPSAVADVNFDYDEAIESQVIAPSSDFTTWDAFLSNTDLANCPITSCTISKTGNCGSSDFEDTDHVVFDTASPWGFTMPLDIEAGFAHDICIECSNLGMSAQIDNWSIILAGPLCPTAEVSLANPGDYLLKSVALNSGTDQEQTVLLANFKDKFSLSIDSCFVEDYLLMT